MNPSPFYSTQLFSCLLISVLLFAGCQDDDGPQMGVPANSFDIGTANYPTSNAYILLDDGPNYSDQYGIVLANGDMREDNTNGISMNTNSEQAVVLWVKNSTATLPNEQDVMITVGTHILDAESTAIYDIVQYDDTYTHGTDTYGEPDSNTANTVELGASGSGSVVINSISIDYATRLVQLDISYQVTDGSTSVSGQYSGNAALLNGF